MPTIFVAGDIYAGRLSAPLLEKGEPASVFHRLLGILKDGDLRLANLEGPLCDSPSPIAKIGPLHAMPEKCAVGLRLAGFDVLNLGNNHIMDQGAQGLQSTIVRCKEQGIACVGAGPDVVAAGQPVVKSVHGVRVGFLSYAEHEFGMASSTEPGANPLNLIHFMRVVGSHRNEWDYLVVLLHGGNEYYPYPRPDLQDTCRFMIEQGADAVICQHSHCAGCYENYQDGYIVYGQGNLLFDERTSRPCEQDGFLVRLDIEPGQKIRMRPIPFFQSRTAPGPDLDTSREAEFLDGLEERSQAILQPGFVQQQWDSYCRTNTDRYLGLLLGYNRRLRELDKKVPFLHLFRSRSRMRMLLQLLRCESHREVLIGSLNGILR
jgi:poly-gamma-glutamate capsule biosynthesis protein CapA/YwtB (metallophosphatase superfamily)